MVSPQKLASNRENSSQSTGPRTAEGKTVASQNPIVHGLRAKRVVMITENRAEFDKLCQDLYDEWRPLTLTERHLVEDMACCRWKLGRMETLISKSNLQSDFIRLALKNFGEYKTGSGTLNTLTIPRLATQREVDLQKILAGYERQQGALERAYYRALDHLLHLMKLRGQHPELHQDPGVLSVPNVVPPAPPKAAVMAVGSSRPAAPKPSRDAIRNLETWIAEMHRDRV